MKTKWIMMVALMVLMSWASGALAEEFIKIGKLDANIVSALGNLHQGDPMDSVLVIKGRIDMGQMNYYSVIPDVQSMITSITIDNKNLEAFAMETGAYKLEIAPQLKSSASMGWALYIYCQTGNDPAKWQKFKNCNNLKMTSIGVVKVKTQQNGSATTIPVTPGMGTAMTKTIGPVQPK